MIPQNSLLPNAENVIVDIRKLRDYSLNPNHPTGKDKARLFSLILGINADMQKNCDKLFWQKSKLKQLA